MTDYYRELNADCRRAIVRTGVYLAPIAIVSMIISALLLADSESAAARVWAGMGPMIYAAALAWMAYRLVLRQHLLMWTPLPWFLVACAVYFGFGSTLYTFASTDTIRYADLYFPVSRGNLLTLQILNNLGILLIVVGTAVGFTFGPRRTPVNPYRSPVSLNRVAIVFLSIGLPVRYLLDLPAELGLLSFALPGSIKALGAFATMAIVPLTVLAYRRGGLWIWALGCLLLAEAAGAAITLSKMALLIPAVLFFLGSWYVRPSKRLLIAFALGGLLVYVVTVPLVTAGRIGLGARTGTADRVSTVDRAQIVWDVMSEPSKRTRGLQAWWVRLSYANMQAYALERYDAGYPGESLQAARYVLIPRVLWSEKPIVSDVGRAFNNEVTGNWNSSIASGAFAEAYWNAGWPGVVLVCLAVGAILGLFGRFSVRVIAAEDFLFLPVVFLGVRAGFRPDGWIVIEYIGGPALAIVFLASIWLARIARRDLRASRVSGSALQHRLKTPNRDLPPRTPSAS